MSFRILKLFKPKAGEAHGVPPAEVPSAETVYAAAATAYEFRDFSAAVELYDRVIVLQPDFPGVHYKRGNALRELGRLADALASYDSAVQLNAEFSPAWCNRGAVLQGLSRPGEALASYERAILLDPDDALAHSNRGALLQAHARWEAALASYDRTLALNPRLFQIWFQRGNVVKELGHVEQALASYVEAVNLKPDYAEAHYNCGVLQERRNQPRAALACYERAITAHARFHQAHFNRGGVLKSLGELEAALDAYDAAVAIKGDYVEAFTNRGVVLQELGRSQAALSSYDQAIAIRPDHAEAHFNRGTVLRKLAQWDAALAAYDQAVALKPDYAAAHCDRATVLTEIGRMTDALASYDRAVAIQPDFAEAQYNRSLALLLSGNYDSGWPAHEWRRRIPNRLMFGEDRAFVEPLWLGEESLVGKTLLVHAEQGLGDVLQFCRFATAASTFGATVIAQVYAPLRNLISTLEGVSQVIDMGGVPPTFDYQCPLMSLPLAFKTSLDTIPAPTKYLHSDPGKAEYWRRRLGHPARPRVGLAWRGNAANTYERRRSFGFADLLPHLPTGFEYYSLHKEVRSEDRAAIESCSVIHSFDDSLMDFDHTAALCDSMDLVLSVDTSLAHLSAALGRPTWILLPFIPDWRWLIGREDSPWYPTVRLYRQSSVGDWRSVFNRVAADLTKALVSGELMSDRLTLPSAADH